MSIGRARGSVGHPPWQTSPERGGAADPWCDYRSSYQSSVLIVGHEGVKWGTRVTTRSAEVCASPRLGLGQA